MRILIPFVVLVSGCSYVPTIPLGTHKIDVQQGNYVSQDMVEKLKPGMTRAQVRFLLGTPLVVDPFRTDRWDYVYLYNKAGTVTEQRRMSVFFKDDKLDRFEGDAMPARVIERPSAAAPATPPPVKPGDGSGQPAESAKAGDAAAQLSADPAKAGDATANPAAEPPKEERGFFGRMLEKIGL